jgi:hypothetical protein
MKKGKKTMNSKFVFLFGLATGGAVGAFVSWRINKARYDKIMAEETASMREVLARKNSDTEETPAVEPTELPDEVVDALKKYDPTSEELKEGGKIVVGKHPYVITPDEYGEKEDEGYTSETLTYYADHVLTYYITDEVVEDVHGLIGSDSLSEIGKFEEDVVHVRNDALKMDFEILLDSQKYTEVKRTVYNDSSED